MHHLEYKAICRGVTPGVQGALPPVMIFLGPVGQVRGSNLSLFNSFSNQFYSGGGI